MDFRIQSSKKYCNASQIPGDAIRETSVTKSDYGEDKTKLEELCCTPYNDKKV